MNSEDKFLQKRNNDHWHYARRVQKGYSDFDKRGYVRKGLDTKSIEVARERRDLLVEAGDLYWAGVSSAADGLTPHLCQRGNDEWNISTYDRCFTRSLATSNNGSIRPYCSRPL